LQSSHEIGKIPSTKKQITNKLQIPIINDQTICPSDLQACNELSGLNAYESKCSETPIWSLYFGNYLKFEFCYLGFKGILPGKK